MYAQNWAWLGQSLYDFGILIVVAILLIRSEAGQR
jgi:hypothetical protein